MLLSMAGGAYGIIGIVITMDVEAILMTIIFAIVIVLLQHMEVLGVSEEIHIIVLTTMVHVRHVRGLLIL